MSREIKFNFYNKITGAYTKWGDSNAGMSMCAFFTHEHLEFLQFTGVKDENGVEIFVGDIVDFSFSSFRKDVGQVKFGNYEQDGSGEEYPATTCIGFYIEVPRTSETLSVLEVENVNVIGNIYGNPELLKGHE